MAIQLGENSYGSARIRVLRVARQEGRHDIKELTLAIRFEGDFETAHRKGDNRNILPADSIKNTVYALARQHPMETAEHFSLHLADHFLTYNPQISRVRIDAAEHVWARLPRGDKPRVTSFVRAGEERRTATVNATRKGTEIRAGIDGLLVLKTSKSSFENFRKDPFTTLEDDPSRILCTVLRADWLYADEEVEFGQIWHGVRDMLLEAFAEHEAQSLQHTMYAMGETILNNFDQVREIHLALPDKRFQLIDLAPLGTDNPGNVYLPMEEPIELAEATVRRN
jgi:urate oxidase